MLMHQTKMTDHCPYNSQNCKILIHGINIYFQIPKMLI